MKLYHYSNVKIESIDMSKCDGFWMTDISPSDSELFEEIGANGFKFCHVCEIDIDNLEVLINGNNENVAEELKNEECEVIENRYDGFNDYAVANPDLVNIIEVIKL